MVTVPSGLWLSVPHLCFPVEQACERGTTTLPLWTGQAALFLGTAGRLLAIKSERVRLPNTSPSFRARALDLSGKLWIPQHQPQRRASADA
jgi:hypothetical protein